MKTYLSDLTEAEETVRGEKLVVLLKLKEARQTELYSNRTSRYNPPRYYTAWGTKTALGAFRSIAAVMEGNE